MGSGSSRLASRPSAPLRRRLKRNRTFSSLLICGACSSSSSALSTEIEDDNLLMNSEDHRNPAKLQKSGQSSVYGCTGPRTETGKGVATSMNSSAKHVSGNVEASYRQNCSSDAKESVPSAEGIALNRGIHSSSTSCKGQESSDLTTSSGSANADSAHSLNVMRNENHFSVLAGHSRPSSPHYDLGEFSSDEISVENHANEAVVFSRSDYGSASVSDSSETFHSLREDIQQEESLSRLQSIGLEREHSLREGRLLPVDAVSITSDILSSSSNDVNNNEHQQNGRRLFWDAFSRRSSRRQPDSRNFAFTNDGPDDMRSHDRWLSDFGGTFFHEEAESSSRLYGRRSQGFNEQRRQSRSEIWERLRNGFDAADRRNYICPSGIHSDGACSCESRDSGTRASISRIVMLAEALFEVLDEIHRQPISLSLPTASAPAPESVVDSFLVKKHKKPERTESGDDVMQCYICLGEYEDGDNIRVLPCHHEYHMTCVDKWLKEIHGICPLCRRDVCEGPAQGPSISSTSSP